MNSQSKQLEIRNGAFIKAREKLGLSLKELAGQACLSIRQIEQIENGEMSSFYGVQVKLTAAKKVAKLLGLKEDEAFNRTDSDVEVSKELEPSSAETGQLTPLEPNNISELHVEKKPFAAKPLPIPTSMGYVSSKKPAQKHFFIWGSVIAAAVFSVMNVRPLFFADQEEKVSAVKEELIEQAPLEAKTLELAATSSNSSATPALVAVVADNQTSSDPCPTADAVIASYKPDSPKKPADMIFVQAKTKQVICVVDASGKAQNKTIEPGIGASFFGNPPFKVLSAGLSQVDIFFQGGKVRPPNADGKTILLEAGYMSQPAIPSDSQLR